MTALPTFVSIDRLAKELDCSESTVREYVRRGLLPEPDTKIGTLVRWRWSAVVARIDADNGRSPETEADEEDPDVIMLAARGVG